MNGARHSVRCLLCFLGLLCFPAQADELRLKDGTKIVGKIVGFEDGAFKVETSYGFALVRRDKVASIVMDDARPEPPPQPKAAPAPAATPPPPAPRQATAPPPEPVVREEVVGSTYINHTYGFQMFKPPSWELIEGARAAMASAVVAMGTGDERTYLVVGREVIRTSLESQAAATERRLRDSYENYRLLDEQRTVIGGVPASLRRFRGIIGDRDWSGTLVLIGRGNQLFTILGMTSADSDLIQIQENVIARAIASLEFTPR